MQTKVAKDKASEIAMQGMLKWILLCVSPNRKWNN